MKEDIFSPVTADKAVSHEAKTILFIVILADDFFAESGIGGDGLNS